MARWGIGRWIAVAALAVLLGPALVSAQDLTVVSTTTANGKQVQKTDYISAAATRTGTGDGSEVILRLDQKKMYLLRPAQKTYSEMTFDDLQAMASKATAAMEKLPPEAAAQMQKMMGGMGIGEMKVTDVGPGEAIAGYATEKYHVVLGTMMEGDIWAAPALALPTMFYDAMKAATPANPILDMRKLFDEYKKIKGMPLKTVTNTKMMGQSMTSTTLATSVSRSPIPASTFEVPAGFKLVPIAAGK
jgi:hypothetical protein